MAALFQQRPPMPPPVPPPVPPAMHIYDDELPNPAATSYPTEQPAPAPSQAPYEYLNESQQAPPSECYKLETGSPLTFSPNTALFTNHCLRMEDSNQFHEIEVKATMKYEGALEMVVSTEPLTDVIDPNTRSMRSCAEICDLQYYYFADCQCYSALRNEGTGESVFMVNEGIDSESSMDTFFSILTDSNTVDTLQITQYDHYDNVMENMIRPTDVPMDWILLTVFLAYVMGVVFAIMVPKSKKKGIRKYRKVRDEVFFE